MGLEPRANRQAGIANSLAAIGCICWLEGVIDLLPDSPIPQPDRGLGEGISTQPPDRRSLMVQC